VTSGCLRKQTLPFDLVNEVTILSRSCHRIVTTDQNMQDILQICTLPTDWWAQSQSWQCV